MGFVVIEYHVLLTRDEVIKLLIDSEKVETVTADGENIVIMGSGTDEKYSDYVNGGISHVFHTNVDFLDHDEYLWTSITLTTKNRIVYDGVLVPVHH